MVIARIELVLTLHPEIQENAKHVQNENRNSHFFIRNKFSLSKMDYFDKERAHLFTNPLFGILNHV